MRVTQHVWAAAPRPYTPPADISPAHLLLTFGPPRGHPAWDGPWRERLQAAAPQALHVACTAGGQIAGSTVVDDALVTTAVTFAHTRARGAAVVHATGEDSRAVGECLGAQLPAAGLRHVLVFADGSRVNGSALVRGMSAALPPGAAVTGGLAADGDRFGDTLVGLDAAPAPGVVAAVGLYGDRLVVGTGTRGGWERFGPERRVTRATGNVLHELDGEPALALYRRYLGDFAHELPASALLFPLGLATHEGGTDLVRTVLATDDTHGTMTFAGDVPEGASVRFMKASRERLIDAAADAAALATDAERAAPDAGSDALALLVSCVGRRWVLGQRVEEELEAAADALGPAATATGFYSYGELAPAAAGGPCELHNQTMTITTLREA